MKVICYTSSTLRKRKNKKAKKRKACSTFSSLERKGKGRKLCLPTSSFCLRFFTVYRNTQRIDLHTEAKYELRPANLFFRAKRGIRGCFVGKFCFARYIYMREEWIFCHKTRCGPQSAPVFFSSQAGIQRSFLDVQSLTGLYTDIRSGRIGHPKTRYELRPAILFFRVKREIRGCFGVKNPIRNYI